MTHTNYATLPIILASTSPRRKQLLTLAGINYSILSVDIDETPLANEMPTEYIQRMVSEKSNKAIQLITDKHSHHNTHQDMTSTSSLVITADTIGVLPDGKQILVKPNDKQDAFAMWQEMSGTVHYVWTAVQLTLISHQGHISQQTNLLEKTKVEFVTLSDKQMQDYWQTGEPIDKAGGYAIQGRGAAWVNAIYGSYTNVVGLPLAQTLQAIESMQNQFTSLDINKKIKK